MSFGLILRSIRLEIKQIKVLAYSLDLTLCNKYLELFIQCREPKIFNEKDDDLFVCFRLLYRIPQISH